MSNLQDMRKARGLVGKYVADRLGIGASLFSSYECGLRPFPVKHFPTLSKLYGVPIETIVKAAGVQHGSKSASNNAGAGKAPGV